MHFLQGYRKSAGLSQGQLAARLGIDKQSISNWERGTAPIPAKHLPLLEQVLEAPLIQHWREQSIQRLEAKLDKELGIW